MAKKQRKMTEAEITDYANEVNRKVGLKMDEIKAIVPPGYMLTLIARYPGVDNAHIILTNDADIEGVADCLLSSRSKLTMDKPS